VVSQQSALDIYVVIAKEERRPDAIHQMQLLRDEAWRVDYPMIPAKVGKQFQMAEAMGARITILYGDEWPQVKIKTLATRDEILVPHDQVFARVRQLLSS
jgi:histidyl-tRNA synthetase